MESRFWHPERKNEVTPLTNRFLSTGNCSYCRRIGNDMIKIAFGEDQSGNDVVGWLGGGRSNSNTHKI